MATWTIRPAMAASSQQPKTTHGTSLWYNADCHFKPVEYPITPLRGPWKDLLCSTRIRNICYYCLIGPLNKFASSRPLRSMKECSCLPTIIPLIAAWGPPSIGSISSMSWGITVMAAGTTTRWAGTAKDRSSNDSQIPTTWEIISL